MELSAQADRRRVDLLPLLVVLATIIGASVALDLLVSARQMLLFWIGGALGLALYQASFGFTGGWKRFATEGRSRSMRMQFAMIGLAACAMIPLTSGLGGAEMTGAWAPIGVSMALGALIFGLGMQLGGGCGSGTLFTVGGGSARMLVTLAGFIIGATVATAHLPFWFSLPQLPLVRFGHDLGVWAGLALTLALLALVIAALAFAEKRRHGNIEGLFQDLRGFSPAKLLHGPWPLALAALVLALGNIATLLVAGHPWSVTYGFGLWGAKLFNALGIEVASWPFWQSAAQASALKASVLYDNTSVMNFGVILGAALAASLAAKFAPKVKLPWKSLAAALIGGLLMGYGARLSFGCNIGALFSGIATGSAHGWIWFIMAFIGSLGGIALRPAFGLDGFRK